METLNEKAIKLNIEFPKLMSYNKYTGICVYSIRNLKSNRIVDSLNSDLNIHETFEWGFKCDDIDNNWRKYMFNKYIWMSYQIKFDPTNVSNVTLKRLGGLA